VGKGGKMNWEDVVNGNADLEMQPLTKEMFDKFFDQYKRSRWFKIKRFIRHRRGWMIHRYRNLVYYFRYKRIK